MKTQVFIGLGYVATFVVYAMLVSQLIMIALLDWRY